MGDFDEFVAKQQPKYQTNVEGAFDCQTCDEFVDKAYYDGEGRLLIWRCTSGHVSNLKDFHLG